MYLADVDVVGLREAVASIEAAVPGWVASALHWLLLMHVHTSVVCCLDQEVPRAQLIFSRADVRATPKLDLGKLASVRAFAAWASSASLQLDVLVNNAGANFMGVEPWYTEQGVAGLPQVRDRMPVMRAGGTSGMLHGGSGLVAGP